MNSYIETVRGLVGGLLGDDVKTEKVFRTNAEKVFGL
jgi:hypothetical protein